MAAHTAGTGILDFDTYFQDGVVGFVSYTIIGTVYYFQHFSKVAKSRLASCAPVAAQNNINLDFLLLLPPLDELRRLAQLKSVEVEVGWLVESVLAGVGG